MKPQKRKPRFQSEVDRLEWLIQTIKRRFARPFHIKHKSADDVEAMIVCGALVRLAASYANGIHTLLVRKLFDAALPIERSLDEIWCEFRYLLRFGSKIENVRKLQINAILELADFFEKSIDGLRKDPIFVGITRVQNLWQKNYPQLFNLVKAQRSRGRFHWSGSTRTKLHEIVGGVNAKRIYKILSWESHGVMTAIRDLEITLGHKIHNVVLKPLKKPGEAIKDAAYRTSGTLFFLWNEYAETFELRLIKPPTIETETVLP